MRRILFLGVLCAAWGLCSCDKAEMRDPAENGMGGIIDESRLPANLQPVAPAGGTSLVTDVDLSANAGQPDHVNIKVDPSMVSAPPPYVALPPAPAEPAKKGKGGGGGKKGKKKS